MRHMIVGKYNNGNLINSTMVNGLEAAVSAANIITQSECVDKSTVYIIRLRDRKRYDPEGRSL